MSVGVRDILCSQLVESHIGEETLTVWDHWQLYLDPEQMNVVADMLEHRLRAFVENIDYLCPIPKGGIPLGTILASRLGLPLLNLWWNQGPLCPERIPSAPRLVLFDPDVKSGWALHSALLELSPLKPRVEFLLTVLYHDRYPPELTVPLRDTWYRRRKVVHLFTMSELLDSCT